MKLLIFTVVFCLVLVTSNVSAQAVEVEVVPRNDTSGVIIIAPKGGTHGDYHIEQQLIERIQCVVNSHLCLDTVAFRAFRIDSIATNYGACYMLKSARLVYNSSRQALQVDSKGLRIWFQEPSDVFTELNGKSPTEQLAVYRQHVEVVSTKESNWGLQEIVYRPKHK